MKTLRPFSYDEYPMGRKGYSVTDFIAIPQKQEFKKYAAKIPTHRPEVYDEFENISDESQYQRCDNFVRRCVDMPYLGRNVL